jgi:uncharacterized protein (TIGR03067 family)
VPFLEEGSLLNFLSPSENPEQLGRLGRYEILQMIGRGGMGVVLKALDPSLQRIVAIKVLAPHLATNHTARRRFKREAQAAAAVSHDHVVTIHEVDEANGFPYLVMQYIPGMSLQDCIDKSGPLALKEILRIGLQTASGLAAAHSQGLIHRDIKPANILLENGVQRVRITDFGLARAIDDAADLTGTGVVTGTPQYMAPEQARGEVVDYRADLFSLGSVLYTMCTGRAPFRATTPLAVLRQVSDDTPRPIQEINPAIPDWLVAVITKLHAKNPAHRYQSAKEVAEVLGQHLADIQQAAWTPPPEHAPVPPVNLPRLRGEEPVLPISELVGQMTALAICPRCACQLRVPDNLVGHTMKCPRCDESFHVEASSQKNEPVRKQPRNAASPAEKKRKSMAWVITLCIGIALLPVMCCGLPLVYALVRAMPVRMDGYPGNPHAEVIVSSDASQTMSEVINDLPRLKGKWQVTELREDGITPLPAQFAEREWAFDGDKYRFKHGDTIDEGTVKLDSNHDPKWIDIAVTSDRDQGLSHVGIYKLVGDDELVLYFAAGSLFAGSKRERPVSFSADRGTGQTLYVLKRKKS